MRVSSFGSPFSRTGRIGVAAEESAVLSLLSAAVFVGPKHSEEALRM